LGRHELHLIVSLGSKFLLGLVAVRRCRLQLAGRLLLMPAKGLLISLAAYRALLQLTFAPYLWEKTESQAARSTRELCKSLMVQRFQRYHGDRSADIQ
jgi:hypothetical protein